MQSTYDRVYYYKISDKEKACLVEKVKALLDKKKEIKLAWLFGSITRRDSIRDVDVAVYAEPQLPFKKFLYLNSEIEQELRMPVDLLEIRQVPPSLKGDILQKGLLIKGTEEKQKKLLNE